MSPRIGYDPARVAALIGATREAIDGLASIRSDDPSAGDAVRVAANARRNLEDLWMPLLREIESSEAMVAYRAAALAGWRAEWAATAAWLSHLPHRDLTDAELLAEVARLDELVPVVDGADDGAPEELDRWLAEHRGLARELARRLRVAPQFEADLRAAAYGSPVVGMLAADTSFPARFRADVLAETLAHPWWEAGWEMDKYANAADALMESLIDDPARCLDVLGRDEVARTLAGWPPLDQEVVARFAVAALLVAPSEDPARLPDGYRSLRGLVELANEPTFDRSGFRAGMASGVARAIGGYVPTLAPGLENEHMPVVVKSHGIGGEFDFTLGSREEVVDFFGALARTPAAQVELGAVLDAAVGDALGRRPQVSVGDVGELAELIELAARNEDDELAIAAAARRSNLARIGGVVGAGVAIGTAVLGLGPISRAVIGYSTGRVVDSVTETVRTDTIGGGRVRAITYQSIQLEACRRFATDPAVRRQAGAGTPGDDHLRAIERHLATAVALLADEAAGAGDRQRAVLNLVEAVRAAGGGDYLDGILEENSVDDLNEAVHTADA